jgi:sec-independent protein translocase protein TatB
MFDFGFWELVLVMMVALLVVGPERLPGLAKQVGLWIGKAKRFVNSVRSDLEREIRAEELKQILNQQQNEIEELKGMLAETHSQVKNEFEQTTTVVDAVQDQLASLPEAECTQQSLEKPESSSTTSQHDAKRPSGS